MFLSFLNTMLPNCRTADTTLSIAALTEKQGQDGQQYVGSRHEIFLESRCPAVWQAKTQSKTILTCILLILVYLLLGLSINYNIKLDKLIYVCSNFIHSQTFYIFEIASKYTLINNLSILLY